MLIVSTNDTTINYSPKNYIEEVITNVGMILRVYKQEQPLNRNFALDSDLIDKNINVVKNRIMKDLIVLLEKYEPRAILKNVQIKMIDEYSNNFEIILGIEVIRI